MKQLFFDHIEWVSFNRTKTTTIVFDKTFPDYWGLQFCAEGELTLERVPEKPAQIRGPAVWLTEPGKHYRYFGTWAHRHICFKGPIAAKYLSSGLLPDMLNIPLQNCLRLTELFDQLIQYLSCADISHDKSIHMLNMILFFMQNMNPVLNSTTPLQSKIIKLGEEIARNPVLNWDFKLEALRLHTSLSHLRYLFKKTHRTSSGSFLILRRLEHAAQMLRESDLSIKEIAAAHHFSDVYYFTKIFSKVYRLSPGRYRRQMYLISDS